MNFLDDIFTFKNGLKINGLTKELNCFYVLKLFEKSKDSLILVTNTLYEANTFFNLLQTYTNDVILFPMDDFLTSVVVAESPEFKLTRLESLKRLKEKKSIVITNLMGYLRYLPSVNNEYEIKIKMGNNLSRDELVNKLDELGYKKESIVTSTGEYAVRGFIVDVFSVDANHPFRIEFFDNEIESLRMFDETTQMSLQELKDCTILPIKEITSKGVNSLLDYAHGPVVFIDYDQIEAGNYKLETDIFEYQQSSGTEDKMMFSFEKLYPEYVTYLNNISSSFDKNTISYNTKEIINYNMNFERLKDEIYSYRKSGKEVLICCSKQNQIKELKALELDAKIINFKINQGFMIDNYVVIGENDLELVKHQTEKYKNNYKFGKRIKDYNQLEIGDYVVHIAHGIGIYNGLVNLTKNGVQKDYLQILYAGNDKIYVPVEKITSIYKYSEKEGTVPKINKLNSTSWAKTKAYVASKIKDISASLIKLYKERLSITNKPYILYPEMEVFNKAFEYELTKDQDKSIKDILLDLESNHPMDRLLCGDVGFGKTEVAFRAMFEAVLNNEQVMYLCPTTILSKQQYEVALKRFADWPISIAILNRFVTPKEARRITTGLKEGKIDIVIGTHRLLSSDVEFNRLGLLIVDEEQRFGVSHKEKIKELKKDVNVLTLSATPIPRTLKMALSGLRDLSIIDTPPIDRYPVQTYVIKEDDWLIKDAIYKELSRDGQVFILYNYVESIESQVFKLKQLVPDADIRFAHGQMNKDDLEQIMDDFINHKFDVLVCTTIIESGIDIPNTNTLIVYDSDRFGLSQLYQIRGRVGRSNRIAYCYLLYDAKKILNENAVKRLSAIKEFTELGSGYKIAMRDLSIRGAGDIFGASQAGFVDSVGISLYMKMIEDEVKRQKGEEVVEDEADEQNLLNIETHISDNYVSDEDVKIEIHQRINEIDSLETFNEVKKELEDRFGKITDQIENYMYEEWFEALAKKYNITKVVQTDRLVQIEFPEELSNRIEGDKLLIDSFQLSRNFNLKYEHKRIYVTLYIKNLDKHFVYYLVNLLTRLQFK
jgi:transcription-repair coupling factor (superfamily II helicase)